MESCDKVDRDPLLVYGVHGTFRIGFAMTIRVGHTRDALGLGISGTLWRCSGAGDV